MYSSSLIARTWIHDLQPLTLDSIEGPPESRPRGLPIRVGGETRTWNYHGLLVLSPLGLPPL